MGWMDRWKGRVNNNLLKYYISHSLVSEWVDGEAAAITEEKVAGTSRQRKRKNENDVEEKEDEGN